MTTDTDRQTYEKATIKVLFFILTRKNGESKRIDMNTEVIGCQHCMN